MLAPLKLEHLALVGTIHVIYRKGSHDIIK